MLICLALGGMPVAAVAQSEEPSDSMAPAVATIEVTSIHEVSPGTLRSGDDGLVHVEGVQHEHVWTASDPRLSGTVTSIGNHDVYPYVPMEVQSATYEVVNDGGRWLGTSTALKLPDLGSKDVAVLRGEGDYEGLTAYVYMDWAADPPALRAAIFPGQMPPLPEPGSAE
jgi:hypothetical protein